MKRDRIADYQRKPARLRLKKHPGSSASDHGCYSDAGSVAFPSVASCRFIWFKVAGGSVARASVGNGRRPQPRFFSKRLRF